MKGFENNEKHTLEEIAKAVEEGVAKFGGKKPNIKAIKTPLRDGDIEREDDEAYANAFFLSNNTFFIKMQEQKSNIIRY